MFYPFLSPHPWISVNARMEKCSPRQVPLSSVCTDLRAQPLALPNMCKHKIHTGLPSNSVVTFILEAKPSCYLLSAFRPKQQQPFLVCWPVTTAQPSWLFPASPKTISRAAGCQQELTFAAPTQLYPHLCLKANNWQFLYLPTGNQPESSINRNSQAKGGGNPSSSPVGSFPLCPEGSGFYPGSNYLKRKSCCNLWS